MSNSGSICALGLLGNGIGSCGTGLGSKGGGNPSLRFHGQTFVFVLMWTSELPSLYICMQKKCQYLIGHSRPACTATMRKFSPLWPPGQAINLPSRDIFCFSWARKWTRFVGSDWPLPSADRGKHVNFFLESKQCVWNLNEIQFFRRYGCKVKMSNMGPYGPRKKWIHFDSRHTTVLMKATLLPWWQWIYPRCLIVFFAHCL